MCWSEKPEMLERYQPAGPFSNYHTIYRYDISINDYWFDFLV